MRKVAIFRDKLLAISETFIINQSKLTRYESIFLYIEEINQIPIEKDKKIVIYNHKFEKLLHRHFGIILSTTIDKLSRYNFNLIHAHFGPDGLLAIPIARALNLPLIVTFHGFDIGVKEIKGPVYKNLFYKRYLKSRSKIYKLADTIIAVSEHVRQKLIEDGCPSNKIVVHYTGIPNFEINSGKDEQRTIDILFVGRLVEKKGVIDLIRSIDKIQQLINFNLKVVIVGDGPLMKDVTTMASESTSEILITGALQHGEVEKLMRKTKIFCTPSKTASNGDFEAFGMVFAEALAAGAIVVSNNHGGIPEIIRHNYNGFLAVEGDIDDLSHNLIYCLQNFSKIDYITINGRKTLKRFDSSIQNMSLEVIYDSVIMSYK